MGPPRSFPNFEDETLMEGGNPWQHKQERKLRGQPTVLGFGSSYLCKKPYFTDFCFDDRWNIHISTGSCLRVKSPHVSLTTTHLPTCCAFRKKLLNISLDPSKGSWRTVKKKKNRLQLDVKPAPWVKRTKRWAEAWTTLTGHDDHFLFFCSLNFKIFVRSD